MAADPAADASRMMSAMNEWLAGHQHRVYLSLLRPRPANPVRLVEFLHRESGSAPMPYVRVIPA